MARLFMIGAFCAVTLSKILSLSYTFSTKPKRIFGQAAQSQSALCRELVWPEIGAAIIEWSVPLAILFSIPVMLLIGFAMERGLDQALL